MTRLRVLALLALAAVHLPCSALADCPLPASRTDADVLHVIDGDTLLVSDAGKIRLIGIDTPEVGRDGASSEPLADLARETLSQLIAQSGGAVRFTSGKEVRDRYQRRLAHVYDQDGRNLSEELLRRGLAYLAIIPPNDRFSDCYLKAETEARARHRGLWRAPALQALRLTRDATGFERIAGRVERVRRTERVTWIEMEGGLQLRILSEDLQRFDPTLVASLPGGQIEIRGWLYRHRGRPRMRLRHPSAIILETAVEPKNGS